MGYKIDLAGKRFGSLCVVGFHGMKGHMSLWKCKCDCGKETVVYSNNLRRGLTKSCGCGISKKAKEIMTVHGMSDTRLHIIWIQMRARCEKPNKPAYKSYGGRGIKVCNEWSDFTNFYEWAINNGYSDGLTLDRVNNDGNYEPSNCRWATQKQQCRNTRSNRNLTHNGETHCVAVWSEITGISASLIVKRIDKLGWDVGAAITKPPKSYL